MAPRAQLPGYATLIDGNISFATHDIRVRLYVHKTDVVILTRETVGSFGGLTVGFSIQGEAMTCSRHRGLAAMRKVFTCTCVVVGEA